MHSCIMCSALYSWAPSVWGRGKGEELGCRERKREYSGGGRVMCVFGGDGWVRHSSQLVAMKPKHTNLSVGGKQWGSSDSGKLPVGRCWRWIGTSRETLLLAYSISIICIGQLPVLISVEFVIVRTHIMASKKRAILNIRFSKADESILMNKERCPASWLRLNVFPSQSVSACWLVARATMETQHTAVSLGVNFFASCLPHNSDSKRPTYWCS